MRSHCSITGLRTALIHAVVLLSCAAGASAQRIAVLTPDDMEQSEAFAQRLAQGFSEHIKILDDTLARSAFDSFKFNAPFNLTTAEAQKAATAMGCDFFVLVRASVLRRSSSTRSEYYDANAAILVVSGRTGRLVWFDLIRRDVGNAAKGAAELMDEGRPAAFEVEKRITEAVKAELGEKTPPPLEEVPDAGTALAKNFRAPVPYRRIKPTYTEEAALYDVRPTVEIEVDLTADGTIAATRIVRWAGYGLDESVVEVVHAMNWRPAERGGKPVPMRFLLRYNFKRTDQDRSQAI